MAELTQEFLALAAALGDFEDARLERPHAADDVGRLGRVGRVVHLHVTADVELVGRGGVLEPEEGGQLGIVVGLGVEDADRDTQRRLGLGEQLERLQEVVAESFAELQRLARDAGRVAGRLERAGQLLGRDRVADQAGVFPYHPQEALELFGPLDQRIPFGVGVRNVAVRRGERLRPLHAPAHGVGLELTPGADLLRIFRLVEGPRTHLDRRGGRRRGLPRFAEIGLEAEIPYRLQRFGRDRRGGGVRHRGRNDSRRCGVSDHRGRRGRRDRSYLRLQGRDGDLGGRTQVCLRQFPEFVA